ncbi:uncharacterized protein JN550_010791 [Neoarthrinium moseri]|uniref:uncharacterized protein n=1 Tax=Neoarthrinium moseri TaxID=1658444 RepID=UPI001FDC8F79|nr:uncharacterized protein JN550_010791 [Neoarthrinium moseri]KAI1861411.1 hypothetical protein JN550_010791 [Neoarthrinium moseri]
MDSHHDASLIGTDGLIAILTIKNLLRLLGLWVVYRLALALYNISPFHPLYRFPGPRLAAASFIYEFWFDFVLLGRYSHEIKRMHDFYGPIVRINPEELHCNDPDFTEEIYPTTGRVRDKQQHYLNTVAGPLSQSSFATIDHETHRIRRSAVNRFFSRAQMLKLESEVHEFAQLLCDKLLRSNKAPIPMIEAYNCFTADTISQYAYGRPLGFLAQEDWLPNFKAAFDSFTSSSYFFRFFPPARNLVHLAPYLAKYGSAEVKLLMTEMTETIPGHIIRVAKDRGHGRIFSDLLDSSLPEEEKSIYRLSGEGFSLKAAGTETTATTLTAITYYLLAAPEVAARLRQDLKDVDPKKLSWTTLEKYPYLWAVINEGLRLTYGLSPRSPRIARDEDLVYRKGQYQYIIPRGYAIGMSSVINHHNEEIFPDSEEYIPERWLDVNGQKKHGMEKYLMSFSKGSRQCLGMNLALCELYLVTAAVTLRVLPHMKLYETTIDDVKYDHDLVTYQTKKGSKGIRVTIL